jgi:hypothetical protein
MRALIYLVLMYLAAYLSACGGPGPAPAMAVDVSCQLRATTLQLEVGASPEPDHLAYCNALAALILGPYYDAYQEWRPTDMTRHVVRVRVAGDLRDTNPKLAAIDFRIGGETYDDAIDLAFGNWKSLAHEMNHVARGSGHGGWCVDFGPWAWETLQDDERSYLHCDNY